MGHIALYREWRPKTFDEVVEQQYTVAALKQAVISNKIAHAYLFSGTRGTGKTTLAQVFSRAINCLNPENGNPCNKCEVCKGILDNSILDVVEMDAASNNSVDNIRRLCDEVIFAPSIARFKVYIIDEVHMLSTGAFNALLKTLEEPPAHAVFILATTEPHRIPATIISRCQRYEFRRISVLKIIERLKKIALSDKIEITDDALATIAKLSDGALRDAISLLDQAKSAFSSKVKNEDVLSLVGLVDDDFMLEMAKSIIEGNPASSLELVEKLIMDGRDVVKFTGDMALYFRNIMICQISKTPEDLINYPEKTIENIKVLSKSVSVDRVMEIIKDLSSLISDLKWSQNPRIIFEIALVRLCNYTKPPITKEVPQESEMEDEKIEKLDYEPKDEFLNEVFDEPTDETPNEENPFDDTKTLIDNIPQASEKIDSAIVEKVDPSVDMAKIWPKLLDELVSSGHMTLYLFLIPGKPTLKDGTLTIEFAQGDELNNSEVSSNDNKRIISDTIKKLTDVSLTIVCKMAEDINQSKNDAKDSGSDGFKSSSAGAKALEDSAKDLGISFYKEE